VIFNPAGEINRSAASFDQVLRQLVELLVAKALGARVAVINHTIELEDPRALAVLRHCYRRFDHIVVRDPGSADLVTTDNADCRVTMAPDLAFLAGGAPGGPTAAGDGTGRAADRRMVGLAVNQADPSRAGPGWAQVVRHLESHGRRVRFVSNALRQDRTVAAGLVRDRAIEMMRPTDDYGDYVAMLGELELVISSRLHTCIFALCAGTPVIPIEPFAHKVSAFFGTLDYPLAAIRSDEPGWPTRVEGAIDQILAGRGPTRADVARTVQAARAAIEETYAKVWQDLAGSPVEADVRTARS